MSDKNQKANGWTKSFYGVSHLKTPEYLITISSHTHFTEVRIYQKPFVSFTAWKQACFFAKEKPGEIVDSSGEEWFYINPGEDHAQAARNWAEAQIK